MHGTKVGFMRDILSEAKSHLRQNEVNHMEVPHYQEISVKNLCENAMKDEVLAKYLPRRSSCRAGCQNVDSSSGCCALCGTST
jgi:hypothetical protein